MAIKKKKEKKVEEDVLTFEPKTGLRKSADNIKNLKAPSFEKGKEEYNNNKDKFSELKNQIHNLEFEEFLIVSNKDTGMNLYQLRKRLSNIALCHKNKYVEKDFSIKKVSEIKLKIHRIK